MKILEIAKKILWMLRLPIAVIVIGIIVGLITNNGLAGFFTTCALIVAMGLYGMVRGWIDMNKS
jgi:TRAP-type C4-dicarboxylate transport system permease large subunit